MSHNAVIIGRLQAIWRYPIKSMAGETLSSCAVTRAGLHGDRTWALRDSASGLIASAKQPKKWLSLLACQARLIEDDTVLVTLPDGTPVRTDDLTAAEQLARHLGRAVTLCRAPTTSAIEMDDGATFELPAGSLFDLAPVHLLSTATLDHLAHLAPVSRFDIRRFRPNLVVATTAGAASFLENAWIGRTLRLGAEVRLHITAACIRCVMTTLSQPDLPADPAILRTAVQHNHAAIGVNATLLTPGTVHVDDAVVIE